MKAKKLLLPCFYEQYRWRLVVLDLEDESIFLVDSKDN